LPTQQNTVHHQEMHRTLHHKNKMSLLFKVEFLSG